MANHLRKRRSSESEPVLTIGERRFAALRNLFIMPEKKQDRILAIVGDPVIATSESFEKFADSLIVIFDKEKSKTKPVPDEV